MRVVEGEYIRQGRKRRKKAGKKGDSSAAAQQRSIAPPAGGMELFASLRLAGLHLVISVERSKTPRSQ
jgi:hypothetical protein